MSSGSHEHLTDRVHAPRLLIPLHLLHQEMDEVSLEFDVEGAHRYGTIKQNRPPRRFGTACKTWIGFRRR